MLKNVADIVDIIKLKKYVITCIKCVKNYGFRGNINMFTYKYISNDTF